MTGVSKAKGPKEEAVILTRRSHPTLAPVLKQYDPQQPLCVSDDAEAQAAWSAQASAYQAAQGEAPAPGKAHAAPHQVAGYGEPAAKVRRTEVPAQFAGIAPATPPVQGAPAVDNGGWMRMES